MSKSTGLPAEMPAVRPPETERRAFPRYSIVQRCFVWLGPFQPLPRGPEGWRCIAYDISASGIGVTLPVPLPLGSLLHIEPWGLPGAQTLQARVVRNAPVEFLWFCGCELLEPLNAEGLRAWTLNVR